MPNETDPIRELNESRLAEWWDVATEFRNIGRIPIHNLITALRATRQELAKVRLDAEASLCALEERIAELEQQPASRPYYLCDAPACAVCDQTRRDRERIAELRKALDDLIRLTEHICKTCNYAAKLDMHRDALTKEPSK